MPTNESTSSRHRPVVELATWLASLDDEFGPGVEARRTVTLTQIIDRARSALHHLGQSTRDADVETKA